MNKDYTKLGILLFTIILIVIIILLLRLLWVFFGALVLAFLIVNLTYPLFTKLRKLLNNNERLAAWAMTIIVLIGIIGPFFTFAFLLSQEAHNLYLKTKGIISNEEIEKLINKDIEIVKFFSTILNMAGKELTVENITKIANDIVKNFVFYFYKEFNVLVSNIARFLLSFLVMTATVFTLYRRGDELKNYLIALIPIPQSHLEIITSRFNEIGRSILFVNGLSGVIQGTLFGLSILVAGLGAPIIWGTIGGFLAFLPIVGLALVNVPATLILLVKGNIFYAVTFFLFNLLHSSLVEYIMKPRLISKNINMSGLLVFIGIIGGMQVFGILGLFYGPLVIALFLSMAELYKVEYREFLENGMKVNQ